MTKKPPVADVLGSHTRFAARVIARTTAAKRREGTQSPDVAVRLEGCTDSQRSAVQRSHGRVVVGVIGEACRLGVEVRRHYLQ